MTHKEGDRAYIIVTRNITTGDRADHEFTNWNKAMTFGKRLPDGITWDLHRCTWIDGHWYQIFRVAEIMAEFDRAIILQEGAIAQ